MAIDTSLEHAPPHKTWTASSIITHVVMHGRGALVTRRVTPPEDALVAGEHITVSIPDITQRAARDGVSVHLSNAIQQVQSVRSELVRANSAPAPEASKKEIRDLRRTLRRLSQHREQIKARYNHISGITLMPERHRSWREKGPLKRIETSLQFSELINTRQQRHDEELLEIDTQFEALKEELRRAEVLASQQSSATTQHTPNTTTLHVTLLCVEDGKIEPFTIRYLVHEARWWPLYTLRLTQGGTQADLSMEAMVTQDSGEDWDEVHVALSTADLTTDAQLPELAALKLGKRRPAKRSGYREAPDGLDRLFMSYDAFMARQKEPEPSPKPKPTHATPSAKPQSPITRVGGAPPGSPVMPSKAESFDDGALEDDILQSAPMAPPAPQELRALPTMAARSKGAGFGGFAADIGGAAADITKKVASSFERQRAAEPTRKQRALIDDMAFEELSLSREDTEGGYGGGGTWEHDGHIEPTQSWLDFAQLSLSEGITYTRGKLHHNVRGRAPHGNIGRAEAAAVESELIDPRVSRGHYDHRYESGTHIVSIPSDGVLHRIDVLRRKTDASLSWRCVPIEEEEVFRLAHVTNPFDAPMLTGPIDVFVEGSFLLSTRQHHVDVGAKLEVGLGVDERIRVARNVRTEEEQHGLLGGKTSIAHTITTELASSLGFEAKVKVIDRIPITQDDDVHIKELEHDPPARAYTQREHFHEVKGGRYWNVTLPPGQKQTMTSRYTITISSKEELVGGNRRD